MESDSETKTAIMRHWQASDRGEIDAEHAIYAADAILDYPQSGERFRGREAISAQRAGTLPIGTSPSSASSGAEICG